MNTKKTLLIVTALALCGSVSAQTSYYNTRHEVAVAVGAGATTEIFSGLADFASIGIEAAISTIVTGGLTTAYYTYGDEHYIPTISAEYYYHVNPYIGLGGIVAFNGMSRDMYYTWKDNTSNTEHTKLSGKAKRYNYSVLPAMKVDWLRKKYIGLYSKAALGISIMCESQKDDMETAESTDYSDTTFIPNIQLTFIGFEAGSETWRGFAEYGFGEQGILSAGLRYKF